MSNFPNMSYCMCENTMASLRQVYEAMRSEYPHDFFRQMSKDERAAFSELAQMCRLVADTADDIEMQYNLSDTEADIYGDNALEEEF